jgi:hypothetical protein
MNKKHKSNRTEERPAFHNMMQQDSKPNAVFLYLCIVKLYHEYRTAVFACFRVLPKEVKEIE